MIKYIALLLSIIAAFILYSCSEDIQGPNTDSYKIVFKVSPDTIDILAGESVSLKAILKDTILSGNDNKPLPDKSIIWQIIMGGGKLSATNGDSVIYQSMDNLPQQQITAVIKAFPHIDVRHQRYVIVKVHKETPAIDTGICFKRDILPIFNSNCAVSGCHNKTKAEEGYILDSYQNIVRKGIRMTN